MEIDSSFIFNILVIVLLLFSNAFFVISEFAFVSAKKSKIFQLAKEGNKSAQILIDFFKSPDKFIASIQLGVTISSIGMGWAGENNLAKVFESLFTFIPGVGKTLVVHGLAAIISFGVVTVFLVVLGELVPKSIALQYSERIALVIARPIKFIATIFSPCVMLLNLLANLVLRSLKIPVVYENQLAHSIEEFNILINASYKEGMLNYIEKDILQNVFKMSDITAKQAMTPRLDMVCIPCEITIDKLKTLMETYQYTRYPVYDNDPEHIIGIAHIKDIYPLYCSQEKFNISKVARKPLMIPETITIDNLLLELKRSKQHLAIAIDEFGGTSGLITIEDILEEIFGKVMDEFDCEEEPEIEKINDNEYLVNALLRIDEINELLSIDISEEDVETIGGVVLKKLGKIAETGDEIITNNHIFTVKSIEGPRILKINIKKIETAEDLIINNAEA